VTTSESLAKTAYTPRGGLALSCAILLFCMLLALLPVAAWASANHGWLGVQAAAIAWLLCTVAAFAALLISVSFASTPLAASANLGSMGIRMGIPLFGLIVLPNAAPSLAAAGLLPSLLACYLVALVVETLLALRHVAPNPVRAASSGSASSQALEAK
jgi:hypothetical protein